MILTMILGIKPFHSMIYKMTTEMYVSVFVLTTAF